MSKHFKFSESLEKSNRKKWSQIWKHLLKKGVKLPWRKVFFTDHFHLFTLFKPFRFSESLGKSNGKRWSQIGKLLLIKGENLPRQKNIIFFVKFCLASMILFGISATICISREMLCLLYAGFSQNRPTGPIRSSSQSVCTFICPLERVFLASTESAFLRGPSPFFGAHWLLL